MPKPRLLRNPVPGSCAEIGSGLWLLRLRAWASVRWQDASSSALMWAGAYRRSVECGMAASRRRLTCGRGDVDRR